MFRSLLAYSGSHPPALLQAGNHDFGAVLATAMDPKGPIAPTMYTSFAQDIGITFDPKTGTITNRADFEKLYFADIRDLGVGKYVNEDPVGHRGPVTENRGNRGQLDDYTRKLIDKFFAELEAQYRREHGIP